MLNKKRNALFQELIVEEQKERDLLSAGDTGSAFLQVIQKRIEEIKTKLIWCIRQVNLRVHEQMELLPQELDNFTKQEHLNGVLIYGIRRALVKSGVIQRMAAKLHLQQYRETSEGINESRFVMGCVKFCIMHWEDICCYGDEEVIAMLDRLVRERN